jgi:four helix bundle protein
MWREGDYDGAMAPFRTLKAWQHAHKLAVDCGNAARTFPLHDRGVMADQLMRASASVPLNIAEGCSPRGSREFRRSLDIARGSLAEVESALELAKDLGYLSPDDYDRLQAGAVETSKTVWGLLRKVSLSAAGPGH